MSNRRRIEGGARAGALRAHARALQYALATPAPARGGRRRRGERACGARVLTCADGFLVLAGDDANGDANEDAASGNENDGNGGPPRRARPRARRVALPRTSTCARTARPDGGECAREGGADVLAAGARGFVLVDLETEKARVFGDVSQEKAFVAVAAAWVGDVVAVVVKARARGVARRDARAPRGTPVVRLVRPERLLYGRGVDDAATPLSADDDDAFDPTGPRAPTRRRTRSASTRSTSLDASSALLDAPLPAAPLAVNAHGPFLLVALAAGPARVRVPPRRARGRRGLYGVGGAVRVIVTGARLAAERARRCEAAPRRARVRRADVDTKVLDVARFRRRRRKRCGSKTFRGRRPFPGGPSWRWCGARAARSRSWTCAVRA